MWKQINGVWTYIPEHVKPVECFPPTMKREIRLLGDRIWDYFDPTVLITIDCLRKRYGTVILNTWGLSKNMQAKYGFHQFRGYRPLDCTTGAKLSQHKLGKAADPVFVLVASADIRADILADPFHDDFKYIMSLEMEVSWMHFDTRPWNKEVDGVLTFTP